MDYKRLLAEAEKQLWKLPFQLEQPRDNMLVCKELQTHYTSLRRSDPALALPTIWSVQLGATAAIDQRVINEAWQLQYSRGVRRPRL